MDTWLQECPNCSYVATSLELPCDAAAVTSAVSQSSQVPLPKGEFFYNLSRRFAIAALLAEKVEDAKSYWLCCAWIADDAGERRSQMYCRDKVRECFNAKGDAKLEERVQLVDVLRRAQRFEEAAELADSLLKRTQDEVLVSVLKFGKEKSVSLNSDRHTVNDAIGTVSKD